VCSDTRLEFSRRRRRLIGAGVAGVGGGSVGSVKALLRLYKGALKALLRLY
jgi:hypothetical protein